MPRPFHLNILVLSLLLAAPLRAGPEETPVRWIWTPGEPAPNQTAHFQRAVAVRPGLESAWITGSADDVFKLSVNGTAALNGSGFDKPVTADLAPLLKPGTNQVHVLARNYQDRAGIQLDLELVYRDGSRDRVVTDRTWSAFATKPASGAAGEPAREIAPRGQGTWGAIPWVNRPGQATPASRIEVPPGFRVDLVYNVPLERQGSWTSLLLLKGGRLMAGDQQGGLHLLRVPDAGRVLTEKDVLPFPFPNAVESQGLAAVDGTLFMVGKLGDEAGVFRFRDTKGGEQPDAVDRILPLSNVGHEHGPHNLVVHPDQKRLYLLGGNLAPLPEPIMTAIPNRKWKEDALLPSASTSNQLFSGVPPPGGWVVSFDLHGKDLRLEAVGLRNAFDMVFNREGDLFTCDSETEWDVGMPWYRPARLLHILPGADYGWRSGTAAWPLEQEDGAPTVGLIGRGSPTGMAWGSDTVFPSEMRNALFIADWTYGRISMAFLRPEGASYSAKILPFLQGDALPIVKLMVNPQDGCLYFLTGGRRTQSGLYRVSYTGRVEPASPRTDILSVNARNHRQTLESWARQPSASKLDTIWPSLGHGDRAVRHAARIALERLPWVDWEARACAEEDPARAAMALLALARVREGKPDPEAKMHRALAALSPERQPVHVARLILRARQVAVLRHPEGNPGLDGLEKFGGIADPEVRRLLRELRAAAQDPSLAAELLADLERPGLRQPEAMEAAFLGRTLTAGWTASGREAFSRWISSARRAVDEGAWIGGDHARHYLGIVADDFLAKAPEGERESLRGLAASAVPVVNPPASRPFVQGWLPADFEQDEVAVSRHRHFDAGHRVFREAGCFGCHLLNGQGGAAGPDLTTVGSKYRLAELAREILQPSAVIPDDWKQEVLTLADGKRVIGRIVREVDGLLLVATDPRDASKVQTIPAASVSARARSPLSPMPVGLLNGFTREEVMDLLAYLRAGGLPDDPAFE